MNITASGKLDHQAYLNATGRFSGTGAMPAGRRELGEQWRAANRLDRASGEAGVRTRPDSAEVQLAREAARRAEIVRRRDSGDSLAKLAKRFRSTPGRISRVVAQEQLKRVQELQLDYIPNDRFKRMSAAQEEVVLVPHLGV